MRKIQEVLRLKFEQHRGHRAIAASCGIGVATVSEYLKRARDSGLEWAEAARMSEAELEARLFPKAPIASAARATIDFSWVHRELRRTGVTLQLLWSEYVEASTRAGDAAPYQYSQFCARYLEWRARVDVVMRQVHRAGEKAFIDFSGKRPSIIDASTGEVRQVELFVMVLGASSYTFAEATRSQKVADFTSSVVRGLEYFGGVPEILVPDQLCSAVSAYELMRHAVEPVDRDLPRWPAHLLAPAQLWTQRDARDMRGPSASIAQGLRQGPPERLVAWAQTMGPSVAEVVEMTLSAYPRPEMGYRPVLGILRSGERHGAARFDAACARALTVSGRTAPRRKFIEAILEQHLETAPIANTQTVRPLGHHDNVRGGAYYNMENGNAD